MQCCQDSSDDEGVIFEGMELWEDPVKRCGVEAMAVDEWLLETRKLPLLRVYGWKGCWGSVGYFGKIAEAREELPGVEWVRRWTGGGTVDHREDWTYSLIVPRGTGLDGVRSGESYRLIHECLMEVLGGEGVVPGFSRGRTKEGGLCFENPVAFDIEDEGGSKLAGAAQRRSRLGMLHQGSVSVRDEGGRRAEFFAGILSRSWEAVEVVVDDVRVGKMVSEKYGKVDWTERC